MNRYFILSDVIPPENREEQIQFFQNIFGNKNPLIVEIGSGNGHFLVKVAMQNPHKNFIGTEILGGRARKFHSKVQKRGLKNIAIFKGDAKQFVWEFLYEETVEEFIILFPDPWPKRRHHKHRLLTQPFINMLRQRLVKGGIITISTDNEDYRDWIIGEFFKTGGFKNLFQKGFSHWPEHYPESLFKEKFRKMQRPIYFIQYTNQSSC
ncbi:MAG: tRNA (guanosine(46)-N7)-methyltransferase TrmB [Spirochaetota bacterium]